MHLNLKIHNLAGVGGVGVGGGVGGGMPCLLE